MSEPSGTPGVGTYEPSARDGRDSLNFNSQSFSKEGQSMFAGATGRKSMAETRRTDPHVAPGSYDLSRESIEGRMLAKKNDRLPGFASSMPRSPEYD